MQFCNLSVIIGLTGGVFCPGDLFWRYSFTMRRQWIRLLTALLLAVLIAALPICSAAAEGTDLNAGQQQEEENGLQDGGEPVEDMIEETEDTEDIEDAAEPAGQEPGEEDSGSTGGGTASGDNAGGDTGSRDTATGDSDSDQDMFSKALVKLRTGDHEPYMSGTTDGRFKPDAPITRQEVAQVIYNLLEEKPTDASASFSDVSTTGWAYKAIAAMSTLGVMNGDGKKFRPKDNLTRAEFMVVLSNCFDLPKGESTFPDVPESHWAYEAIAAVQGKGWIAGYSDGRFGPDDDIKRCQVVTVLNSALERRDGNFAADSDKQEFSDVPKSHWAFKEIAEAADPVEQPDPPAPPEPGQLPSGVKVGSTVQVTSDNGLNVREAPVDGRVITAVPDGTLLTVTDISRAPWLGIKTSGGISGFVLGDYVKLYTGGGGTPQNGSLSASSLNMRQYMSARLDATADKQVSTMKWSSSDTNVARVGYTINYSSKKQSAIVYAGSPGTAVLTYSDGAGNKKATCTVTVTSSEPVRFAYPSESIVQKDTDFQLLAITDDSRDQVRFDISGGASYTTDSYVSESNSSEHGLPDNRTRVFTQTLKLTLPGTYTVRAYAGTGGQFSTENVSFTVQVKDRVSYTDATNEPRRLSARGIAVIRDFEGIVNEVEDDVLVSGNPTVGCGYVVANANDTFYNNLTNREAYAMLIEKADEGVYARAVENFRKKHNIKMSQAQFDALTSWVYNIGTGNLSQGATDAADMILNMVVPPSVSASKPASGVVNTSSSTNPAVLYATTDRSGKKEGIIPTGASIKVTEVKVIRSATRQEVWYKTSYGGKTGWVGSGYVKLSGSHQIDLNYADSTSLATELLLWHMAGGITPGLVYRRLDECKIFFFGNYDEGKPYGVETPNYRKNTYGFVYPERIQYLDKR